MWRQQPRPGAGVPAVGGGAGEMVDAAVDEEAGLAAGLAAVWAGGLLELAQWGVYQL